MIDERRPLCVRIRFFVDKDCTFAQRGVVLVYIAVPPVIVRTLWWFHRFSSRTSCGYASYCADSGSDVQKTVETFHSCSSWSMLLVSKFSTFSSPVSLIVLMIAAVTWKAETRTYFAVWWIYILQM